MKILVIDGMGGGIGRAIIEHIRSEYSNIEITAVGTNTIATSAMLKGGATNAATGENALIYNCSKAECIIGVMGIIIANSMHGEISPKMAAAVSSSDAHIILVPNDKCGITIPGLAEKPIQSYVAEINKEIKNLI
ncbi:MAG: DUF3842 family protein [Oscillospiraceae bacterium]|nr:DUF3842 family protein [Oscillospiraceae bacterium]